MGNGAAMARLYDVYDEVAEAEVSSVVKSVDTPLLANSHSNFSFYLPLP